MSEAQDAIRKEHDTVVFTFGRFQPPTYGHKKIVDRVVKEADDVDGGADRYAYVSQSVEPPKENPLKVEEKVKILRKMYPDEEKVRIINSSYGGLISPWRLLRALDKAGYKHVIWICGEDRKETYTELLDAEDLSFETKRLVALPRVKENISGTAMREWAARGNEEDFRKGLNNSVKENARNIMERVVEGMNRPKKGAVKSVKSTKSTKSAKTAKKGGGGRRRTRRSLPVNH